MNSARLSTNLVKSSQIKGVIYQVAVFIAVTVCLVWIPKVVWAIPVLSMAGSPSEYHKLVVAGDPAGTPPDTPANRIDPNTTISPFAGVGSLFMDAPGPGGFLCTGTAITDRHILTAAHCLDSDDDGTIDFAPPDVSFILNFGGDFTDIITGTALDIHPDFTGFNNPVVNDDLAIITLDSSLPAGVPIYSRSTDPFKFIEEITMVGYGTTGDGVGGFIPGTASFDVKRVGLNHADVFDLDDEGSGSSEVFAFDFDGPDFSTNLYGVDDPFFATLGNDIETTLGPGDSGGPSFIDVGGELRLFGVNTFGFDGLTTSPLFGSGGGGMVVSAYNNWIDSIIFSAVSEPIPEPATIALLGIGLAGLGGGYLRRRSRQKNIIRNDK